MTVNAVGNAKAKLLDQSPPLSSPFSQGRKPGSEPYSISIGFALRSHGTHETGRIPGQLAVRIRDQIN